MLVFVRLRLKTLSYDLHILYVYEGIREETVVAILSRPILEKGSNTRDEGKGEWKIFIFPLWY